MFVVKKTECTQVTIIMEIMMFLLYTAKLSTSVLIYNSIMRHYISLFIYMYVNISVRKYVHVCGVSHCQVEQRVEPEIFHLLMVQAVGPPMYACIYKNITS